MHGGATLTKTIARGLFSIVGDGTIFFLQLLSCSYFTVRTKWRPLCATPARSGRHFAPLRVTSNHPIASQVITCPKVVEKPMKKEAKRPSWIEVHPCSGAPKSATPRSRGVTLRHSGAKWSSLRSALVSSGRHFGARACARRLPDQGKTWSKWCSTNLGHHPIRSDKTLGRSERPGLRAGGKNDSPLYI